jgi:hypothetical protein
MARHILLTLLAATPFLVSAVPAPGANPGSLDDLLTYGLPEGTDLSSLVGRSIEAAHLERRKGKDQNAHFSSLPGCGEDDDPSYAQGPSRYKDGEGTLVQSGLCDNKKYIGGWHCWYVCLLRHRAQKPNG